MAVDASTEMPWADIRQDQLKGGIHWELGRALASQLGRQPVFLVLPRQRLTHALTQGNVDLACVLSPEWLPGPFQWTQSFIHDADVLLTVKPSHQPQRIEDLAKVPVGTVTGFRYPAMERHLGTNFKRDDAPNATNNLRKLQHGRIQHAIANERFVSYQQRIGLLKLDLHPSLVISRHSTGCAISHGSTVTRAQVDNAIDLLQRKGEIAQLLSRFK